MNENAGATPQNPIDSPTPWVAEQIAAYVASGGKEPNFRNGTPLLLLTVKGRKSGLWQRTALICGEVDGKYLIVASMGGAPRHPLWYLNLRENPEVQVQVGDRTFTARARTATPEEKPALWDTMVAIYADYVDYQKNTEREIPVVILDPVA